MLRLLSRSVLRYRLMLQTSLCSSFPRHVMKSHCSGFSPRVCCLQALRVPTIVFLTLAVSVIIISILLVWRHLYRTWTGITPDDAGTVDSVTAQQDKELTLMESQLHRSTPIVVLQPDSRVGHTKLLPETHSLLSGGGCKWLCLHV